MLQIPQFFTVYLMFSGYYYGYISNIDLYRNTNNLKVCTQPFSMLYSWYMYLCSQTGSPTISINSARLIILYIPYNTVLEKEKILHLLIEGFFRLLIGGRSAKKPIVSLCRLGLPIRLHL